MATISDKVRVIISAQDLGLGRTLRKMSMQMRRLAVGAQQVGVAFSSMGASMSMAMGWIIKETVSFDDSLRKLAAKTQVAFDSEAMRKMTDEIMRLGASTSSTPAQVAELMTVLGAKGIKPDKIIMMTETVLKFAKAVDVELAEAADGIVVVMNMFDNQLESTQENIVHFADVLAGATIGSGLQFEDLLESFKMIGGEASKAGYSVESLVAQLMIADKVKLTGSKAGRAGRSALAKMFSSEALALLKEMNIELRDGERGLKNVAQIADEMTGWLNNKKIFGAENTRNYFKTVFGEIGGQFATAVRDSSGEINKLEEKLMRAVRVTETMYAVMEGGVGGRLRNLLSAFQAVVLSLGGNMKNYIGGVAEGLIKMLNRVEKWVASDGTIGIKLLASSVGMVAAGFALIATSVAAITAASVISAIAGIVSALAAIGPVFLILAATIDQLFSDIERAVFSAENFAKVSRGLKDTWERMSEALSDVMMLISNEDYEAAFDRLAAEWEVLMGKMAAAVKPLKQELMQGALGNIFNVVGGVAKGVSWWGDTWKGMTQEVKQLYERNTLTGDYSHLSKEHWNASKYGREGHKYKGEFWQREMLNTDNRVIARIDDSLGVKEWAEAQNASGDALQDMIDKGIAAGIRIETLKAKVIDYTKAWQEMRKAEAISPEALAKESEAQYKRLSEIYDGMDKEMFMKQFNADLDAKRAKAQKLLDMWSGLKKEFSDTFNNTVSEDNPFGRVPWSADAKEAKKIIESISYGKLGDFDSGTALAKMNAKLNDTQANQLRELQTQTGILKEIKDKDIALGGFVIV